MSTGDQSGYIRAKMAERGTSQASFSRDGFDNWAESTAPARDGQMEKIPAETQMASRGGAMTVRMAKKLSKHHGKKFANSIVPFRGGAMCGGRSFLGIEVPEVVETAISYGEKLLEFAVLVDKKLPEIEEAIEDEIITNNDDPAITDQDKKMAREFLPLLQALKGYFKKLKQIKQAADELKKILGAVGSGSGNMRGGAATATERFNEFVKFLRGAYDTVAYYVGWITKNANFIKAMLKLRPLQPIGNQILEKINPILSLVGLGGPRGGAFGQAIAQGSTYGSSEDDYAYGNNEESRDAFGRLMKQEGVAYAGPSRGAISGPVYSGQNMGGPMGMQKGYEAKALGARVVGGRKCKCKGGAQELQLYTPEPMSEEQIRRNKEKVAMYERAMKEREYKKQKASMSRGGAFENFMSMKEENVAMAPPPRSGPLAKPRGGATKFVPTTSVGKRAGGRKPSARGEIVKKVMREQGLSLPQASKYVKNNNLY